MKRCREDVIFDTVVFILLTVILIVVAYPLYWVIISSISDPAAVSGGKVLWKPIGFTLKGYVEVFKNNAVMKGFLNSIIYTVCGVCINLIVTLPTAYALSRDRFGGKKIVTLFYMVTMFFGGGLIPTYLVIRNLHMLNTMWALVLPGCLSVYNMIVARTFFKSNISEELYEAAAIDGANRWNCLRYITLPGISSVISVMLIMRVGAILSLNFDQTFAMLNDSVLSVGETIEYYVYRVGMSSVNNYSLGTAIGLFKSLIGFVMVLGANWASKRISEDGGIW